MNMKQLVKTISTNFPNYKFSICRNASFCDLIVKIKPVNKTETFAYYGGDDVGYIVDNNNYYSITNKFQSEFRPKPDVVPILGSSMSHVGRYNGLA